MTHPKAPIAASCNGGALLRELDRIRTLLAARAASRGGISLRKGERLLVVARFAPGLTLEAWNALTQGVLTESAPLLKISARESTDASVLCEKTGERDETGRTGRLPDASGAADTANQGAWFVLSLDPDQHPQLRAICQDSSHLFHAVCPLTGALLPDPFCTHLAGELNRLTDGSELSLVLLELVAPGWMKVPCAHGEEASNPHDFAARVSPFSHTALDFSISSLARVVRSHIRTCDAPGRLAVDRLALILPGTGPFRARALTERLIGDFYETLAAEYGLSMRKQRSHTETDGWSEELIGETREDDTPPVQIRAGIACCDMEQLPTPETLLGHASTALTLARPGHTRTFRKAGAQSPERKTQVQACEKHFLFFGDSEQTPDALFPKRIGDEHE